MQHIVSLSPDSVVTERFTERFLPSIIKLEDLPFAEVHEGDMIIVEGDGSIWRYTHGIWQEEVAEGVFVD